MRVLTWNLFHGRAVPDRPRELLDAFAAHLARWRWDVALLQEVPPWWPAALGRACGASARSARTSRNELYLLRVALARRRPDLIKSNGGGANAILVRGAQITDHRKHRLRRTPERRVVHAVRLDSGVWVANLHAQVRPHALARADLQEAARVVLQWAGDEPAVLGGDTNVPDPGAPGFLHAGGFGVDHVFARGFGRLSGERPQLPHRGGLSDHAAVIVDL